MRCVLCCRDAVRAPSAGVWQNHGGKADARSRASGLAYHQGRQRYRSSRVELFHIFFLHSTCLIYSPLLFHLSHLSYVAEYILNLSTSVVPVNALICHCNLRKLTYREPISIEHVWVFVCTAGFYWQTKRIEINPTKNTTARSFGLRAERRWSFSLLFASATHACN